MIVTALKNFTHGGKRYHQGDTPNLVSTVARELARTGEVSLNGTLPAPLVSRGPIAPSFALPAVPALPPMTLSESGYGEESTEGKSKKQRRKDADE